MAVKKPSEINTPRDNERVKKLEVENKTLKRLYLTQTQTLKRTELRLRESMREVRRLEDTVSYLKKQIEKLLSQYE